MRIKKDPLFCQTKIFPTRGLGRGQSRGGWFLSCVVTMCGCRSCNSGWPGAVEVSPSAVSMPSRAAAAADTAVGIWGTRWTETGPRGERGRRNQRLRYTRKSMKVPSPNIWPGNGYFTVLLRKFQFVTYPLASLAAAMEQRGEKKNSAKEMRCEETGEEEKALNCARACLPLMDPSSHPLSVKGVSRSRVCGWIHSDT